MEEWLGNLFKAIDDKDAARFVSFLTESASFRFGSAPTVSGRKNIGSAVANVFTTVKSLSHRVLRVWKESDAVICEGEVTYARIDGKHITLPFVNIFKMKDDLIADYRVYVDPAVLYA